MKTEKIKKAVTEYCQQHSDVITVYLFGSRAKGSNDVKSDLDLAILLKNNTSSFDLLDFIGVMEEQLSLPVDAVILNRAGEVLKYQVRKHHIVLFSRDEVFRKSFELRSRRCFEDFRHIHKRYTEKVLFGE